MKHSVRTIAVVVAAAIATVLLLDALIGHFVPPLPREYETVESLSDYKDHDPEVLFLGSSYARSFLPLASHYAGQSPPLSIAIVPIEGGKLYAYDWLLQHRLQPLIDEKDTNGNLVRPSLKKFVLVTNYWDACSSADAYPNLPSRAWALGDYLRDFVSKGETSYNTNYLDQRWNELTHWSALSSDRGTFRIIPSLKGIVRGVGERKEDPETARFRLESWIEMVASSRPGTSNCDTGPQFAALERILRFATQRNLDVAIVTWPIIPKAQTPEVLAVSSAFKDALMSYTVPRNIPIIDLQQANVLADSDFRPDLDHLLPSGERKVLEWALTGPFSSLRSPFATTSRAEDAGRADNNGQTVSGASQ